MLVCSSWSMLISSAVMAMVIIGSSLSPLPSTLSLFIVDLGGMIDRPNSHPQKEEYFLLLLVLLFLDLLR